MSLRVCGKCDWVINNRTYPDEDCPKCGSVEMLSPLDDRDWNKMYREQKKEIWKQIKEASRKLT